MYIGVHPQRHNNFFYSFSDRTRRESQISFINHEDSNLFYWKWTSLNILTVKKYLSILKFRWYFEIYHKSFFRRNTRFYTQGFIDFWKIHGFDTFILDGAKNWKFAYSARFFEGFFISQFRLYKYFTLGLCHRIK